MFVYKGNDFINYKKNTNKNYNYFLNNKILRFYFDLKKFFNFYSYLSHYKKILRKNNYKENKVIKLSKNNQTMLFFKDYLDLDTNLLNFSKEFNLYINHQPDYLIILPTKAEIYCFMFKELKCNKSNEKKYFKNINLFEKTKIYDSTLFLKLKAKQLYLSKKKIIYDYDDTHLNEIGISLIADFFYDKIIKNN